MIRMVILSLLLAIGLASTVTASHPYHVSLAEIQFNAERGKFEVALCAWPADLEKAIGKMEKQAIDLDGLTQARRDELIAKYVSSRFAVEPHKEGSAESTTAAATNEEQSFESCKIRWVGSELSLKQAWLYFEIDASADVQKWSFENRLFFELNEDQLNQIQIQATAGKRRRGNPLFSRTLSTNQPAVEWGLAK